MKKNFILIKYEALLNETFLEFGKLSKYIEKLTNLKFNKDNVKKGAVLLDVGITSDKDGIHGDVDFHSVDGIAHAVTPMPGGTGPMTVACLMENTVAAAKLQGII